MYCQEITAIITTSPIPSNPSTKMIRKTIRSIKRNDGFSNKNIIIAMDGTDEIMDSYNEYKQNLRKRFPRLRIIMRESKGYLTGNIENALGYVITPFIFMVQHDFTMKRTFNIQPLLDVIQDESNDVEYILFNRYNNKKQTIKEVEINGVKLMKTALWSCNNHITKTSYYRDVVMPITRASDKKSPERTLRSKSRNNPGKYGTYIYGGENESAMIKHLDGRSYDSDVRAEKW